MSLVENLARRQHSPLELVHAIGALAARGYSHNEIATKVDFSPEYVSAICVLLENGEEKLISAVERGVIPHTIAMEIARAKDGEVQQALAQAYEEKAIPGNQVLAIRQIIEQRNNSGKQMHNRVLIIGYKNEEPRFLLGPASGPVRMGFGLSCPLEFPPPSDSAHEAGSWELDVNPIAIGGSVLKSRLA